MPMAAPFTQINWRDISYLARGNARQQSTWKLLSAGNFLEKLCDYDPVVIGTIPIRIDVDSSDVDIACEIKEEENFANHLRASFPKLTIDRRPGIVVGRMHQDDFDIEIYGEARPVNKQNGFLHMAVEAKLLDLGGDSLQNSIRALKLQGIKTEPAFARFLGIEGDPYKELLKLTTLNDGELKRLLEKALTRTEKKIET